MSRCNLLLRDRKKGRHLVSGFDSTCFCHHGKSVSRTGSRERDGSQQTYCVLVSKRDFPRKRWKAEARNKNIRNVRLERLVNHHGYVCLGRQRLHHFGKGTGKVQGWKKKSKHTFSAGDGDARGHCALYSQDCREISLRVSVRIWHLAKSTALRNAERRMQNTECSVQRGVVGS